MSTHSVGILPSLRKQCSDRFLAIKANNLIQRSNKYIRIIWTPGYCNIKENVEADKAARNAINNNNHNSKLVSFFLTYTAETFINTVYTFIGLRMAPRDVK